MPQEWQTLDADFGGRFHADPMSWDLLRRRYNARSAKYAWKAALDSIWLEPAAAGSQFESDLSGWPRSPPCSLLSFEKRQSSEAGS